MKEYAVIIKYSIKAESPREAIISANGVKDSINEKHFIDSVVKDVKFVQK